MGKHRHVAKSEFEALGPSGEGWERLSDFKKPLVRVFIRLRRGLNIAVEHQRRVFYPNHKAGACCEEERTVINVYGSVQTAQDAKVLAAAIERARMHVGLPVRRVARD